MSISELKKVRKHYFFAAAFCLAFGLIYEIFSHNVWSIAMLTAFLWPLIGGGIIFTLLMKVPSRWRPNREASLLYGSGLALAALGSIFKGVLDIYGTTNRLLYVYIIGGAFFLMSGVLTYILQTAFCPEEKG